MAPKMILFHLVITSISCFDIEAQLETWCKEPIKTVDLYLNNLETNVDLYEKNLIHRCGIWIRHLPNEIWTSELTEIFRESFKSNLHILKISDGLRTVDQNFFSLESKLKYLDLSGNDIDFMMLPEQKQGHSLVHQNIFDGLYTLDLSRNKFSNISFVKNRIPELTELDLSWNTLKEVPLETLIHFSRLEKLIISHNNITKFQTTTGYSSVEYLDLSNNHLKVLLGVEKLENLQTLIVSHNDLRIVDKNTFKGGIWGLKDLHLDHNNIVDIVEDVLELFPNLITLKLNNNKISGLKEGVFSILQRLESLDISYNFLTSLDAGLLATQRSLIELNLKNNSIETFNYTYMTDISPSLNQINVLENSFKCGYFQKMLLFLMEKNVNVPGGEVCLQVSNNTPTCCTTETTNKSRSYRSESEAMKMMTEKNDSVQTLQKSYNIYQFFSSMEKKSDALIKVIVYQFAFIISVVLLVFVVYLSRNFGKKKIEPDRKLPELEKIISS